MAGILEKVRPLGYTPLISRMRSEVLKYNFRGIGRLVVDKSGHGNNGKLTPKEDPPRRKIISWFPFQVAMIFNGKDDRIVVPDSSTLDITEELTIETTVNPEPSTRPQQLVHKDKRGVGGYYLSDRPDHGWIDFVVGDPTGYSLLRYKESALPRGKDSELICKFTPEEMSIKLNGEAIKTKTPEISKIGTNNLDLGIGARYDGWQPFNGAMKKVIISGK